MGFTRYWIRPKELDAERFVLFSAACRDACADMAEVLANTVFGISQVSFEGKPRCETFTIDQVSTGRIIRENGVFECCKTQKLPYDAAVAECLDLLKDYFPEVEIEEPS